MTNIYHLLISTPLLNILVFLYNTVSFHDIGIAIVVFTVLIRLALYPLFQKSMRHQLLMQEIQPKLKALQDVHKGNYEAQSKAMMDLYREHKINPFSGFFLLIIQLPILFAVYRLFLHIFQPGALDSVYHFLARPEVISPLSLGLVNLQEHNYPLVVVTAILQYIQTRLSISSNASAAASSQAASLKMMSYIGPIITLVIFARLPAAVTIYWMATSLISIAQQYIINRQRANATRTLENIR